jgi:catechol 2,3-dioxygenase-like lactoylglutathione lyase family enzyme
MTRPVEGLAEIVLWVRDMEVALHFYQDLFGLEVMSPPELPIKFLKASEGELSIPNMLVLVLHPDGMAFPREKGKRVLHHIAFRVGREEYEALRERFIADGVEVRSGVHPVLKGVRTFYVDDPEGNEVEVIAPA